MKPDLIGAESLLVGDIYDAALNPALWPQVLRQIVELSESNSAVLTVLDELNPDYTFAFSHNIPEEALRVYREAKLDVVDMEVHAGYMIPRGLGSTMRSTEAYGTQEEYVRRCGDLYQRCFVPSNVHYLVGVLLDHADFRTATLGIHRPAHWAPPGDEQERLLGRLGNHLRRALQIHRQITAVQQRNAELYRLLDGLVAGVLLLNLQGQVRYANPRAESLLAYHGALRATREGLQASLLSQKPALQALIHSAIATGRREADQRNAGGVIGLQRETGATPLMLTVTPLSELAGYRELASEGVAAAVFLTDPDAGHVLSRKLLKNIYGLHERECEVCEAFVNHTTLEGVAGACGLSLASVRTYMKGIYEKTGRHSQAQLLRLLMGLTLDFEHIRGQGDLA